MPVPDCQILFQSLRPERALLCDEEVKENAPHSSRAIRDRNLRPVFLHQEDWNIYVKQLWSISLDYVILTDDQNAD